jgi:hypothetical protein
VKVWEGGPVNEDDLIAWRVSNEARDGLVLTALERFSKTEVHVLTGLARTTIDGIVKRCKRKTFR